MKRKELFIMAMGTISQPEFGVVAGARIKFEEYPYVEAYIYKCLGYYTITDIKTGYALHPQQSTRKKAVESARITLQKRGEKQYLNKINEIHENFKKYGMEKYYQEIAQI